MDYTVERNLESVLIKVNKFINIDKERERYAKNFEAVRDALFTKLRKYQPFGSLFNGYQIGGSYGDNLKVSIPNEFDVVFRIKFPEYKLIDVSEDYDHPGNVHLNFSRVLMKIRKETQHETTYTFLIRKLLDDDNYLLVERLQSYIQSCFVKALDAMDQRYDSFTLEYSRQGPAHTITVDGRNFTYSIDFVPGILLEESQSIVPSHVGQWEAIPKPIWGVRNSTSFRSSFYMQEKKLIDSNYNLKNALRMMKKFRDAHSNMHNMKSYFIKTLFLWKAKEEDSSYWYKSLSKIIIDH
ncbi:cyclic GMP-AMP synthase-like receptor isoform X2 [Haematobia irritans]|uniref:cyclic GMP-AMP synthase-like receptor isoform X2 n=1 Tax=Haematobia irritans TaxID=7368 RepID=UPI003F504CA0